MKRFAALLGATVIALMATACNQSASTHDADVQSLKDLETQWIADWQTKDAAKIGSHYSDDAVLMVPGEPSTTGKDAILASLKQMTADPALSLKFQTSKVEVAKSGDLGYTQGAYQLTVTDPITKQVINDHGSYVTVYRKQADGTWKAVSDIATSAVPPPAPPPAKSKKR